MRRLESLKDLKAPKQGFSAGFATYEPLCCRNRAVIDVEVETNKPAGCISVEHCPTWTQAQLGRRQLLRVIWVLMLLLLLLYCSFLQGAQMEYPSPL